MELKIELKDEVVQDAAENIAKHLNNCTRELRRLYLVEDYVDSLKVRFSYTVKPVLSDHSKRRSKSAFQDRLSLNAGQKYCRMLSWSILQYFRPSLSYRLSLRPLFCLFLSDSLKVRFSYIYIGLITLEIVTNWLSQMLLGCSDYSDNKLSCLPF